MTRTLASFVHPAVLYKFILKKLLITNINFITNINIYYRIFGWLGRHEVIQEKYKILGGF